MATGIYQQADLFQAHFQDSFSTFAGDDSRANITKNHLKIQMHLLYFHI